MIIDRNYNVDLAKLSDKKLLYNFAKEMNFYLRAIGKTSTRVRTLKKLYKSPAIMASGISNTIFLPSHPDELCDRLKFLLQENQAGNNREIIENEIVAVVDEFLEYKCISKKQHKQLLS